MIPRRKTRTEKERQKTKTMSLGRERERERERTNKEGHGLGSRSNVEGHHRDDRDGIQSRVLDRKKAKEIKMRTRDRRFLGACRRRGPCRSWRGCWKSSSGGKKRESSGGMKREMRVLLSFGVRLRNRAGPCPQRSRHSFS